jgi:Domain of unknown function (DUF4333)
MPGYIKLVMSRFLWVGASLVLVCSGCGQSSQQTSSKQSFEKLIRDQSYPGLSIDSVTCPEPGPVQAGKTFVCQVRTSDGNSFRVRVTESDTAGNGHLQDLGLLNRNVAAKSIRDHAEQGGVHINSISCGPDAWFFFSTPGETFDCKAIDAQGGSNTIRVTVTNETGDYKFELVSRTAASATP